MLSSKFSQVLVSLALALPALLAVQSSQAVDSQPCEPELPARVDPPNESRLSTCKPMLNISSFFQASSGAGSKQAGQAESAEIKFSFPVADMDLPIVAKDSSMSSAFHLLSVIGSQLDLSSSDEPAQNEPPDNTIRFRNNRLYIGGLNLTMLNIHLYTKGEPKFALGFNIKNTTLTGRFNYNGALPILSESYLAGFYRMSIENIYLSMGSSLTRAPVASSLIDESAPAAGLLRTSGFSVNITNLGYISIDISDTQDTAKPTANYLLKMLQRVLQRTIKRTYYTFEDNIRRSLEREARRSLDCELSGLSSALVSSEQELDFGRILSGEIERSQLDRVNLPDFVHQQNVLGTPASVYFSNGSISGLSNIVLTGDTRVKLQDEHLLINSSVGWNNLVPRYNWTLFLGSSPDHDQLAAKAKGTPSASGFVLFNIKGVSMHTLLALSLSSNFML